MTQGEPHSHAVIRPSACKKVFDRSVAPRPGTWGADSKAHPTRWVYEWERVKREVGGVCYGRPERASLAYAPGVLVLFWLLL